MDLPAQKGKKIFLVNGHCRGRHSLDLWASSVGKLKLSPGNCSDQLLGDATRGSR